MQSESQRGLIVDTKIDAGALAPVLVIQAGDKVPSPLPQLPELGLQADFHFISDLGGTQPHPFVNVLSVAAFALQ